MPDPESIKYRENRTIDYRAHSHRQQADIVRLLLLTGCRKSEIIALRWSEVHDGMLALADSKTGPRTVPLGSRARAILDRQPRGESPFVFPSPLDPARPRDPGFPFWYRIRRDAGIEDVRLHDLRHTMASHAVMNGVPVPVVSRLLGHANVQMMSAALRVRTIIDGAVFTVFDGLRGWHQRGPGGVSRGRRRVKPLRGSSASLRPCG